ncbi:MAG TPA: valine--tRNA ligase [Actinomycetes bacterium]|nr:valine--tRNA ligase [Actinomycetes bacterium]
MTDAAGRRELPKTYDPHAVEGPTYQRWLDIGAFRADAGSQRPHFSIALPPPNVTGSLHIGHALDHTFQDYLARMHRMRGDEVLWLPGMDHAGIATQNVVERELAKEGRTRFDLGREAFVERVWAWKATSGGAILGQMRRLGDSVDWSRERFTMDEGLSRAVREVFVSLYEQGLLYRGQRIINWCPRCLTALSDIEVEHEEVPGELAYLRYPLADGSGALLVATSRAETMLGDTGVAVHPDDARYRHVVGRTVRLPLLEREIPVVADEAVDRDFGTGAVKVTPAHDPNDYDIAQRHNLPAVNVLTEQAVVNSAGGPFVGLDRYAAREAVKDALAERGLLERVDAAPHTVGHCYRCKTEVEPRLSLQWFVATKPLADKAIGTVRRGETRFEPARYEKTFFGWMESIRDWCVSRQLWWGHRIPAWYCPDGHVTVAREDPSACAECGSAELRQDEDVLDTWFSSGLWPLSTLGWPDSTRDLEAFYPTSVLVTGYDIIFFWVARMMMFGCHFQPPTPFRVVAIHGMVRDAQGKKMSKSFGNVIDPLELMDRYGTDALRFALIRGANPGSDVPLAEEWVEGGRNFANKLWNLGRFLLSSLPRGSGSTPTVAQALLGGRGGSEPPPRGAGTADGSSAAVRALADRWLLSRLERTRAAVTAAYDADDPAEAARLLHAFAWSELADWAVELAKPRLGAGGDGARQAGAVLAYALDVTLRLLHPIMPFVTEELGRTLRDVDTITLGPWPLERPGDLDEVAEADMADLQEAIAAVRRFRAEHGVPPARRPRLAIVATGEHQAALFRAEAESIRRLARLEEVEVRADAAATGGQPAAKLLAAGAELYLPLAGLLDLEEERSRLKRERAGLEQERTRAEARLASPGFLEKAPAAVVGKARARLAEVDAALAKVAERLEELTATGG